MLGEEIELSDDPKEIVPGRGYYPTFNTAISVRKGLQSFIAWFKHNNPEILSLEAMLWSTALGTDGQYLFPYCGRCDIIATIGDEKWLLDIKSSKYVKNVLNYEAQLTMYKMLYDEMNPDSPIDRMGVVWANKHFLGATPPKSVLETIEYNYNPELVGHTYAIFQQVYDGFKLGQPKLKKQPPKTFSLL